MNKYIKYIFNYILFLYILDYQGKIKNATPHVGKSIVPNECSTLGQNNPLRLLDCSIFQYTDGYCCFLTITIQQNTMECDEESICETEEVHETACLKLPETDSKTKNKRADEFKKLYQKGKVSVLIECSGTYIYSYIILVSLITFFLIG